MGVLQDRSSWVTLAVAACCASLSGAAFLAHAAGLLRMPFFVTSISLPAAMLLVALQLRWLKLPGDWLAQRLWAGVWIGFLGTLAYDGTRLMIVATGIYSFNPFRIIHLLGSLITSRPDNDLLAMTAGWTYHFWNGINFAMMYVLIAGRGRWPYAVAWAMCLEVLMLLTYPGVFGLPKWDTGFITTSMVGHVAYGLVLGLLAERLNLLPIGGRRDESPSAE